MDNDYYGIFAGVFFILGIMLLSFNVLSAIISFLGGITQYIFYRLGKQEEEKNEKEKN